MGVREIESHSGREAMVEWQVGVFQLAGPLAPFPQT